MQAENQKTINAINIVHNDAEAKLQYILGNMIPLRRAEDVNRHIGILYLRMNELKELALAQIKEA